MKVAIWREARINSTDAMTFQAIKRPEMAGVKSEITVVDMVGTRKMVDVKDFQMSVRFTSDYSWVNDYDLIDVADAAYDWCRKVIHMHPRVVATQWDNLPFGKTGGNAGSYLAKAKKVICRSEMIKAMMLLEGVPESKLEVVYPGVDTSKFCPAHQDGSFPFRVLWAGRITRTDEKGLADTIFAVKLTGVETIEIHVAGSGDAEPYVALASKMGVSLVSHGPIGHRDMPGLINYCDVLVCPSIPKLNIDPWAAWVEQWGMIATEAMACGLPVIASDIGAFPEMITDGYDGFLVPARSYHKIAEILVYLMSCSYEERLTYGRAARATVIQRFSSEVVGEQLRRIYLES